MARVRTHPDPVPEVLAKACIVVIKLRLIYVCLPSTIAPSPGTCQCRASSRTSHREQEATNGCASPVAQRSYIAHSYWVYTDPEIYAREQERIFCGRSWAYVALEAEIPTAGDFKRTTIGEKPVVVVRDDTGRIQWSKTDARIAGYSSARRTLDMSPSSCAIHQWTYNLQGDLIGVPFRRGVKQQGGMPADFALQHHGLHKLQVATRHGAVFASFADEVDRSKTILAWTCSNSSTASSMAERSRYWGTRDNSSRLTGS